MSARAAVIIEQPDGTLMIFEVALAGGEVTWRPDYINRWSQGIGHTIPSGVTEVEITVEGLLISERVYTGPPPFVPRPAIEAPALEVES